MNTPNFDIGHMILMAVIAGLSYLSAHGKGIVELAKKDLSIGQDKLEALHSKGQAAVENSYQFTKTAFDAMQTGLDSLEQKLSDMGNIQIPASTPTTNTTVVVANPPTN